MATRQHDCEYITNQIHMPAHVLLSVQLEHRATAEMVPENVCSHSWATMSAVRDGMTHQLVPLIVLLCPNEYFAVLPGTGNGVHWHSKVWGPSNIPHPV